MAKATQKPGQTKEQTKLIAQGIQKGIEEYKKRHKQKSRALDKEKTKLQKKAEQQNHVEVDSAMTLSLQSEVQIQQSKLAWGLLGISWIGFAVYVILFGGN